MRLKLLKSWHTTDTTKLFYNKYKYKITIINQLASIFRDKNLAYAKRELDSLQQYHDRNKPLHQLNGLRSQIVRESDFLEAKHLYNKFTKRSDYTLRIEHPRLAIYSNDLSWLEDVSTMLEVTEFCRPSSELSEKLLEPNVIVKQEPFEWEYKVTFKDFVDSSLAKWIENNRDKVKAGDVFMENIQNSGYINGFYIYVKNEKILQLLHIMVGNSISRIDKIVSIDKNG